MPLIITPACGSPITFASDYTQPMKTRRGYSTQQGYVDGNAVSFTILRPTRALIPDIEALAGKNVVQTINRAGVIQLTSTKLCQFVRFWWDAPDNFVYQGWSDLYSPSQLEGVFTVSQAQVDGLKETLTLTIFRGDWLWQDHQVINFDRNPCGAGAGGGGGA